MTKKLIRFSFYLVISLSFGLGCVSINLPERKAAPANYEFIAPVKPFTQSHEDDSVRSWINHENGNTISVFSACNANPDPSLEILQRETIASLSTPKVLDSLEISFNQRSAILSTVEGKLDGVAVKLKFLILKKNNCHYNLSFFGVEKSYSADENAFNQFLKEFKAP